MVVSLGRFGLEDPESVLARDLFFVAGRIFEVDVACVVAGVGVAVRAMLVTKGVSRLMAGDIKIGEK